MKRDELPVLAISIFPCKSVNMRGQSFHVGTFYVIHKQFLIIVNRELHKRTRIDFVV